VSSQNGEDGFIRGIFRRIGVTNRVFVEIGVGNGFENNTAFLLSQGWTGSWIDGSDAFLKALEGRKDLKPCVKSAVVFVSKENVLSVLQSLDVPEEFDLLSIDIDQNTYSAWEGLRSLQPRVVIVEYNSVLPPDLDWKVNYEANRTWDGSNNFGASLKALELLGCELGYSLVGCEFLGANAFFVRNDLVGEQFAEPFTAENHYEPARFAMINRRGYTGAILDRSDN
jgi:hypothetical protein